MKKFQQLNEEVNIDLGSEPNKTSSDVKLTLLWVDLTGISKSSQFLICCLGVFIFYLLYGFLLELIFTLEGLKPFSWFVTLLQFGYYSMFALTENVLSKTRKRRIPFKVYLLLGGLTLGTIGFSNTSLQHLNYPTQVIFKSCKLIPVMIGGIIIQKKTYNLIDFMASITMCIGLAWFSLADSYISPKFNLIGILMISLALMCDAIIGNVQEKAMKKFNASNSELVLYSYFLGFLYLLVILAVGGKFFNALHFFLNNPTQTFGYILIFSATGYLGVHFVLFLIKTSGALAAVTVTTCRKAISIVLSFILFSKPFTLAYFWSGILVILGIYLNIYSKNSEKISLSSFFFNIKSRFKIPFSKRKKVSETYFSV